MSSMTGFDMDKYRLNQQILKVLTALLHEIKRLNANLEDANAAKSD
jgi:hypothetical protein